VAQSINTNVAALSAQRYLNRNQADMTTAINRLSSGLRINSARDDAAGLAISERFTTQIRGLNQADVQSPAQNVPTYIDGVYIQRNYAIDIGGADVQRIEIVKGPQSALYGQNAFAGAINDGQFRGPGARSTELLRDAQPEQAHRREVGPGARVMTGVGGHQSAHLGLR
jgi:outer membrane receptor protein involved in Fe transport